MDNLLTRIVQKETLYSTYEANEKRSNIRLRELRDSAGTVYASIGSTKAAAKEFAVRVRCTYVLYSAPRYPRLARLLIREDFRNF